MYRSKLPPQIVLLISLLLVIITWSSNALAAHVPDPSLNSSTADSIAAEKEKSEGLDSLPVPQAQRHVLMIACNKSVGIPCLDRTVDDDSHLCTQSFLLAPQPCIFSLHKTKDSFNISYERNFPLWLQLQVILI